MKQLSFFLLLCLFSVDAWSQQSISGKISSTSGTAFLYCKIILSIPIIKKDEKIDVSSFGSGTYTIRIETPDGTKQLKLTII